MPVVKTASPRRRAVIFLIVLGLLALVVHTVFGEGGYMDLRRRRAEQEHLQKEINRLEKENQQLTDEIKELRSDPNAVERLAREELKMARPGEVVVTLPKKKEESDPPKD